MKSGRARTDVDIIDLSVLIATGLKGINAVCGITERGDIGRSRLVGSWQEYNKYFGGLIPESIFPLLCKRAFERGSKLRIGRVAHYTDTADSTTLVGVKAVSTINTTVLLEASSIGTWGNGLTMIVKAAANGAANEFDIDFTLAGYPQLGGNIIRNIKKTLTASSIATFNTKSLYIKIKASSATQDLAVGTATFTLGAEDKSLIVLADYIGTAEAGNGFHIFDSDTDFVRISIPEMAVPALDIALVAYVEQRKDCRAILRTPIGLSGDVAVDYRNGTGDYEHTAINSWRATMTYGGMEILNPATEASQIIPVIGDVLGCYTGKDTKAYEWFSAAGSKRGKIGNALGIEYNLASPAKATEFDRIDVAGINAVVDDTDFGLVYWGNSTLTKENRMTKHDNIAELLIFLSRAIAPLCKSELFDPNDIETWKTIYRNVDPLLQLMVDKRGLWEYKYDGDQNIDDISEATVNTPANLDNGEYVFILWIKPKAAMKYIGVQVVVTNTGVSFDEISSEGIV